MHLYVHPTFHHISLVFVTFGIRERIYCARFSKNSQLHFSCFISHFYLDLDSGELEPESDFWTASCYCGLWVVGCGLCAVGCELWVVRECNQLAAVTSVAADMVATQQI